MQVRKRAAFGDAIQWTGKNTSEVVNFLQGGWKEDGIWIKQLWKTDDVEPDWRLVLFEEDGIFASPGDWIIKVEKSNYGMIVVSSARFDAEYENF